MILSSDSHSSKPVAGVSFSLLSSTEIVNKVLVNTPPSEVLRLVVTTNVDHMVTMQKNAEFKRACSNAWLLTADGFPVVRLLKVLGINTPGRITGADLFPAVLQQLDPLRHSPCFVCSGTATAEYLQQWCAKQGFSAPTQRCIVPAFGFEHDLQQSADMLQQITALNTTHLFFGVGAPKSELWMFRHRQQLSGVYGFGFGAGLDFFAGVSKRAPTWMQQGGLEWLWRLLSDPKRLAKRYLIDSWVFLRIGIQEYRLRLREEP